MDKQEIVVKEFNGVAIQIINGENVNLTNLWKASGSDPNKAVAQWLRTDNSQEFINTLSKELKCAKMHILKTQRGRGIGGTWGHWQIALSYARYLNAELAIFMNQVFRERLQEEADPELGINRAYDRAVTRYKKQGKSDQWISMRFKTILDTKKFHSTIGRRGAYGAMYAKCHNAIYSPILGGTKREIIERKQLARTANIRDNLDMKELSAINLAEILAVERINNKDIQSGSGCVKACELVASSLANAMQLALQ